MKKMFLNRTIAAAVSEEMDKDDKLIVIGEDLKNLHGGLSIFIDVPKKYPDRFLEMPIAELGFAHFGTGAAMTGYKVIIDLMFSDFSTIASDSIINVAAKYRFVTAGKENLPVVYMLGNGSRGLYGGWSSGCNHDQCVEAWFQNVPGLKIVAPYYPNDAKGLLKAAIRDKDPVLFLYHLGSLGSQGEVEESEDFVIPINNAANVIKEGKDLTIVAIQGVLPFAAEAAETLKNEGIDVELIDPRVLVPLDTEKICDSVKKTGRLLIVHEAPVRGGVGGEISAVAAEKCYGKLKAPIARIGQMHTPGPVGPTEILMQPKTSHIIEKARELMKY
jgi:acetoin:2,6-dichlorophenolindophenol oxidoreductase subunit beta